ncbi:MAG: hypothetical protein ABL963_11250 [Longimicrobiales bacterium]
MTAFLYAGIGSLLLVSALTVWELFEAKRLEARLGAEVSWHRAAGALRRRLLDQSRSEYPDEWHQGIRRLQTVSLVRVIAAFVAVAFFGAVIF